MTKKPTYEELKQRLKEIEEKLSFTMTAPLADKLSSKESENRYRHIFENVSVGLIEKNFSELKLSIDKLKTNGVNNFRKYLDQHPEFVRHAAQKLKIINANSEALKLYGAANIEELLSSLDKIYTPDSLNTFRELIIAIAENKTHYEAEVVNKNLSGEKRNILLKIALPADKNSEDIMLVSMMNITKQKKLEAQLRQAHKMEAIGTLTGGIAHDFNNILSIIIGNTELALGDVPEWNPAHLNLEKICSASLRAKDIVRHLLYFARQYEYIQKPIKLIPIIKDALKFLSSTIPSSIEIRKSINIISDTIVADHALIHLVMLNLCNNAAHAMENSGGILEIDVTNTVRKEVSTSNSPEAAKGHYIKVIISDTGEGIKPEIMNKIFDPYFTTKEIGKGSGMGLPVVHGIVKKHSGDILVESEPGKGTVFTLLLPLAKETSIKGKRTIEELPTGDEKVLVIDDQPAKADYK